MVPLGLVVLAVVLFTSTRARPHIGLHGASLGLSLALCGFTAGVLGIRRTVLMRPAPARASWPAFALLALSSVALVWVQPTGPGLGGCLIAILAAVVARVIPVRLGLTFLALTTVFAVLVLTGFLGLNVHPRWSGLAEGIVPLIVPFAGIFLLALVVWRFREKDEQSSRLLLQIEETRGAELRAAALAERQRLARDMHDVLAHSLSGLVLQLEGARLLARSDPGDARLTEVIDRAHQLAKSGLDEARRAIGLLRDEELPGPERLAVLAGTFETDTGIPCRFTAAGQPRELRSAVKLALYRVTQESLTNVRRHAHPDHVDVRLSYQPDEVSLAVEDLTDLPAGLARGACQVAPEQGGGYGLTGMRERAELLGGTLTAAPTGRGFLVQLRVPA
jgi:signal transduction histidine kinase